jgi:plasmid stabilization system protein ParE
VNASRRWKALLDVPNRLRRHPYIGPVVEENPAYRQLTVAGYVLIYRIDPDTGRAETAGDIEIVDVFGPGQEQNAP